MAMGLTVLVPFGENTRYDLVTNGQELRRVQCKTGRLRSGAVIWNMCGHDGHHTHARQPRRDYTGEVDDFAVHCPETRGLYLIPMADLPIRVRGALRVTRRRTTNASRSAMRPNTKSDA
jgi:hypothetical protein